MLASSANPSLKIGYGTWASLGAGRVLVGIDSGDGDFDTIGKIGGEKSVVPNSNNLPPKWYPEAASQVPRPPSGSTSGVIQNRTASGNSTPVNNVQPYIVVAIWKRTA